MEHQSVVRGIAWVIERDQRVRRRPPSCRLGSHLERDNATATVADVQRHAHVDDRVVPSAGWGAPQRPKFGLDSRHLQCPGSIGWWSAMNWFWR